MLYHQYDLFVLLCRLRRNYQGSQLVFDHQNILVATRKLQQITNKIINFPDLYLHKAALSKIHPKVMKTLFNQSQSESFRLLQFAKNISFMILLLNLQSSSPPLEHSAWGYQQFIFEIGFKSIFQSVLYNILMIKATVILLGLILLVTSQVLVPSRNSPVVGGHTPFNNFKSLSFLRVLDAVYADHPEVKGWKPFNATAQYVAGTIYTFYLQSPKDSSFAYVSGIDDFIQDTVTIYKYTPPQSSKPAVSSNSSTTPLPSKPTNLATNTPSSGFKTFTDYTNDSYQKALTQAKNQDYLLFQDNELTGVELYVSSRFYYFRLTFTSLEDSTAEPFQVYEVIAFQPQDSDTPLIVGHGESLDLSKPELYRDAYKKLVKAYPKLAKYEVTSVKKQIVAGTNYFFVLERTNDVYDKVSATVYVDLQNHYQVTTTQNDYSVGYSLDVIEQVKSIATKKWSELEDYTFYQAVNLRSDNTGLRLTYHSLSSKSSKYVILDLVNGKESLTLN